jgi:Replication protein
LTLENPLMSDMKVIVQQMQKSFEDMVRHYRQIFSKKTGRYLRTEGNKDWPGIGYVKSLEITLGNVPGCCHPHFHILLLVPDTYFTSGSYLTNKQWAEMWRKYMNLDYNPRVWVSKVKGNLLKVVPEIFKYEAKEADLLCSQEFLLAYMTQMHRVRSIDIGGVFRQFFKQDDIDSMDLIDSGEEEEENQEVSDDVPILKFKWKKYSSDEGVDWRYQLVSQVS